MMKKLSDLDTNPIDEQIVKEVKNDYKKAKELFLEQNFDKLETIAFRLINDYEVNDETALWISFSYCFMGAVLSKQKKYKDAISNYINAHKTT
jgi:TolA-binding protein